MGLIPSVRFRRIGTAVPFKFADAMGSFYCLLIKAVLACRHRVDGLRSSSIAQFGVGATQLLISRPGVRLEKSFFHFAARVTSREPAGPANER